MNFEPRVQSSYDIDHLATSVVVDTLFGASLSQAANDAAGQVVNFNNP
jgi:NAD(P)H-hydrate repair Nnr-like enzyme with NAD(P)H-hydrate epimerase domain